MKPQQHSSTNVYTVVDLIGEGAHSLVYKAIKSDEFNQIQTTVALKILKSDNLIESWRREFESLRRVRSIHCVAVHSFEWVLDRPALSLEYVDGVSLYELARFSTLDLSEVKEIAHQILLGLRDLWNQGLLHGDLSPTNVLISQDGIVKLLDFGLANWQEHERRATPQFVAPETLVSGPETEASDLFSLGKILEFIAPTPDSEIKTAIQNLVTLEARQRRSPDWQGSELAVQQLSVRVKRYLEARPLTTESTKEFVVRSVTYSAQGSSIQRKPVDQRKFWIWIVVGVAIMGSLGGSWLWLQSQRASLIIRSQQWHRIWINDNEVGYTPIDLHDLKPGVFILRWESPRGSGQRALTLEAGENTVLNDSFFESQE